MINTTCSSTLSTVLRMDLKTGHYYLDGLVAVVMESETKAHNGIIWDTPQWKTTIIIEMIIMGALKVLYTLFLS